MTLMIGCSPFASGRRLSTTDAHFTEYMPLFLCLRAHLSWTSFYELNEQNDVVSDSLGALSFVLIQKEKGGASYLWELSPVHVRQKAEHIQCHNTRRQPCESTGPYLINSRVV